MKHEVYIQKFESISERYSTCGLLLLKLEIYKYETLSLYKLN